jgi:predicted secreted protein
MSKIIEVQERQNGRRIELSIHETLRITLSEARTAGFRWILRTPKQRACSLVEEALKPSTRGAGGTGKHHWDFRAEEVGTTEIVIEYSRPWERATPPARSFSVSVRVT